MKYCKLVSANTFGLFCSAIISFSVTAALAQTAIVDDCEGGTNLNKFGAPWYFYDDSAEGGNSKIAGVTRDYAGRLIGAAPIAGQGYNGTAGYKLSYTLGTIKAPCYDTNNKPIAGCGLNFVGVGAMLAPDGSTCDLTGATSITFWAKASSPLKLNVEVATTEVTDSNYYRTLISISTTWTQYTILLTPGIGIVQQVGLGKKVNFNPKHVTAIHWQVHTDETPPTTGIVNIDQVEIYNYTFIPPDVCLGCLSLPAPTVKAILSNFETTPYNANAAGGWWYCYNDARNRTDITGRSDYSDINAGVLTDSGLALGASPVIAISGHGNPSTGNGAYIGFLLGKTFTQGTDVVKPFVGIGTALCDALVTMFYNASADGVTGVMFDYLVTGAGYVRLDVISSNDLSTQGIAWHRLFPQKAGWQTAVVPFDSLMLPNWDNVKAMDPTLTMLRRNQLKMIQFAVQDSPGLKGTVAIDNVYLIGAGKITPIGSIPVSFPGVVIPVAPADMARIVADSVVLTWQKTTPAVIKYMLQVATDSGMSNILFQDSTITDTTKLINLLSGNVTCWWRVRAENAAGWGQYSQKMRFVYPVTAVLPKQFEIKSFDFNGSGKVFHYALPVQSYVSLKYYDIRGRTIASFINQTRNAGNYSLPLPLSTWTRGTYIQVFRAGNFIKKDRVVVVK